MHTINRNPMAAVYEIIRQRKRHLHLYVHSNRQGVDELVGAGYPADQLYFTDGNTADYSAAGAAVTVSLQTGTANPDGDGGVDVYLARDGEPNLLLRNQVVERGHWLGLDLRGDPANRDAIGAEVTLTADNGMQKRRVTPVRGYLSQVEMPLTFGLGEATQVSVEIRWPEGTTQRFDELPINRQLRIVQGETPDL